MINNRGSFNVSVNQRYLLLICATALCYIIGSVIVALLVGSGVTAPKLRIALVVQDVVMFILPAVLVAVIVSRRPGELLGIERKVPVGTILLSLFAIIASVPAMNMIISWNQDLSLPESLASLEAWMRQAEASAQESIGILTGNTSVGGLVMSLLIIGVMAGLSEELFFRGTIQRIMITTPVNPHLAIWSCAILFSAIHMQFLGFVPRLLLGAFFGYLAWWSGSVWLAVAAHIFNNSMAVALAWMNARQVTPIDIDSVGVGTSSGDVIIVAISVVLTSAIIATIYKRTHLSEKSLNK